MRRAAVSLLLIVAGAMVTACQGDGFHPVRLDSELRLDRYLIDFGAHAIGTTDRQEIVLINSGQLTLALELALESAEPVFMHAPVEKVLRAGQTSMLTVTFVPDRPQRFDAVLVVSERDGGAVHARVTLRAQGYIPDCEDHNRCTVDSFDQEQRACRHTQRQGPCDDGLRCTADDICHRGQCVGTPIICVDDVECTVDRCDEENGCLNEPDHDRCDPGQVCFEGICDPVQGCLSERSADGTLCGSLDCQEMSVCIQGQCLTGPTPDGMPCDDGDPCTAGDLCEAGSCRPGEGQGMAVSTPVDFDVNRFENPEHAMHPVGILAVQPVATGGLDFVWVDDSVGTYRIMRSRVDADGVVMSNHSMALASRALAAFHDGILYLLLNGCRTCGVCGHELRRIGPTGLITSVCQDDGAGLPVEIALAVDASGVYVAQVRDDSGDGEEMCRSCDEPDLPAAFQQACAALP